LQADIIYQEPDGKALVLVSMDLLIFSQCDDAVIADAFLVLYDAHALDIEKVAIKIRALTRVTMVSSEAEK
jgi:hypothetical protein